MAFHNQKNPHAKQTGVRKMLMLIWSKQDTVKDTIMQAYRQLYLAPPPELPRAEKAVWIAKNLIRFVIVVDMNL